jgi:hypothetical protein
MSTLRDLFNMIFRPKKYAAEQKERWEQRRWEGEHR